MGNIFKLKSLLIAGALLCFSAQPSLAQEGSWTFNDVDPLHEYAEAIDYLADSECIEGYADGSFKMEDPVSRIEALKIILESFGHETGENETIELPFSDVTSEAWYHPYVAYGYEKGWVNGYDDGNFHGENEVNLAEALKLITLASGIEINQEEGQTWYQPYTGYAIENGFIFANEHNEVVAEKIVTRGELSDIIYRWLNPGRYTGQVEYGVATWYGNAVAGNGTASGETFDPTQMTAAHKTLPFGTLVKVVNEWNGKSVEVKITDRGPYGEGRIIDLSSSAFEVISPLGAGVLNVRIEILNKEA